MTDKRIFIQVSFSTQEEKDEVINIAKECHKNASEFIRDAIFEKIQQIQNPSAFSNVNTQTISPEILTQLLKKQTEMQEKQEIMIQKLKLMEDINKTLALIQKFSNQLPAERKKIISLFKAHKSLSQGEVEAKTGFDKDTVFQVISDTSTFKLNVINGKFELIKEA